MRPKNMSLQFVAVPATTAFFAVHAGQVPRRAATINPGTNEVASTITEAGGSISASWLAFLWTLSWSRMRPGSRDLMSS